MSLMDKSKDEVPKIRADTIPRLIRPDMSRMAGHFCSVQGKPASSVPILTKEFTRLLKVSLTKSNGDQDQLTVQFRDNDGSVAVAVTQDVASQIKEFVKTEIGKKMENDVLKPYRENKAKLEQQEALKERINQLSQIEPLTAEVAQQIRTCQIQLNGLGQIAAAATLGDLKYYHANFKKIIATREWLSRELTKLGFRVLPSETNFILARPPVFSAQDWLQKLRSQKILVRWFSAPEVKNYLRITIGTQREAEALVKASRQIGH